MASSATDRAGRRRHGLHAGVLAFAVALGPTGCKRPEPPPQPRGEPVGIVDRVKVLAGDILVVDGQHLRLSNAFAPEGVPRARCWAEAVAARQATLAVEDLVRGAHTVNFRPVGGRDEYDRAYAQVSLDGVDLGETLIDEGLAAQPPQGKRFEWCEPLSVAGAGAPSLGALLRP